MQGLMQRIHFIVFGYAILLAYDLYSTHDETMGRLQARIPVVEQKLTRARKKVADLKKYFKDIEVAKKNIERVALEVESVQRRLPSDIADSDNLSLIKEIANKINIKEVFIKPNLEINKGFYYIKNYVLSAEATYLQFLVLFEKIAQSKQLLNIKDVRLQLIEGRIQRARYKLIKGEIVVQAYRYNSDFKEDRGIEEIETKFKDGQKPKPKKKGNKKG